MFPVELVDMVLSFLTPFERFRLGLSTDAEEETVWFRGSTERRDYGLFITFHYTKGYAVVFHRRFTYSELIAYMERRVHRIMNTTPHPYRLRRPRRRSTCVKPAVRLWTDRHGAQYFFLYGCYQTKPFTHQVCLTVPSCLGAPRWAQVATAAGFPKTLEVFMASK